MYTDSILCLSEELKKNHNPIKTEPKTLRQNPPSLKRFLKTEPPYDNPLMTTPLGLELFKSQITLHGSAIPLDYNIPKHGSINYNITRGGTEALLSRVGQKMQATNKLPRMCAQYST